MRPFLFSALLVSIFSLSSLAVDAPAAPAAPANAPAPTPEVVASMAKEPTAAKGPRRHRHKKNEMKKESASATQEKAPHTEG